MTCMILNIKIVLSYIYKLNLKFNLDVRVTGEPCNRLNRQLISANNLM